MAASNEKSLSEMMDAGSGAGIERSTYLRSHSPVAVTQPSYDGTASIGLLSMGKGGSSQVRTLNDPDCYGIVGQYDDDAESDETATRNEIIAGLRRIDPEVQNAHTATTTAKGAISQPTSPRSQTHVADILLSDQVDQMHFNNPGTDFDPVPSTQAITPKVGWLLGSDGVPLQQQDRFQRQTISEPPSPVSNQNQNYNRPVTASDTTGAGYTHVTDVGNRAEQSQPLRIAAPKRQTLQLPTFMGGHDHRTNAASDGLSPQRVGVGIGVSKSPHRSPTRIKSITKEPGHQSIRRSRASSLVQRSISRSPGRSRYSYDDDHGDVSLLYGKPLQPPSPVNVNDYQAQEAPVLRKKRPRLTAGGAGAGQRDTLVHNFDNVEVVDGIWDPVQFNSTGLSPHEPVRLQRSASIPLNVETVVVIDEDADRLEQQQQIKDLQLIRSLYQRAGSLSYSKSPSQSPRLSPRKVPPNSNGMNHYPKQYRGEPYGYSSVKSPPHQVVKSPCNSPPRTPRRGSLVGLAKKTPPSGPPSCLKKSPPMRQRPAPGLVQKGYPTRLPGNQSISASPSKYGPIADRLPYGSPNDGAMAACSISPTSSQLSPARISPNLTFTDKDNKKEYTLMFVERTASQVKSVNFDDKGKVVHINNKPIEFGDNQYNGVTAKISPMLLSTADPGVVSPRGRIMTPPPDLPAVNGDDLVKVSYSSIGNKPTEDAPVACSEVVNQKQAPAATPTPPSVPIPAPSYNTKTSARPAVTSPIASRPTYGTKTSPSSPGLSHASSGGDITGLSYGSKSHRTNNDSNRSETLPVDAHPPPPLASSPNEPLSKVHTPLPAAQALGVGPGARPQGSVKSNNAPDHNELSGTRRDVSDSDSHNSNKSKSEDDTNGCCSCCTIS